MYLRNIRVAVLGHPGGACQQLVVGAHVQQRHRAAHRAEEVRPAHEHVAHQQPAIGSSADT